MEASEAIRRIFWHHRWLLLVLMVVPVAVVVPLREHQPVLFAATAQVQGQNAAPDSSTQVTAIQSRITAAATNTAIMRQAITAAGVHRDAAQVARQYVTVTPLGSSAVMRITVTDAQPTVAMRLAGALATAVVSDLNQLGTQYNPQLAALNKNTQRLTAERDHLVSLLNNGRVAGQTANSVKAQSLLAQLNSVEQQLANNLSSVQQVLASISTATDVQLMSTPTFVTGVSRHAATYGALAALLGLVLGLLFAIVREVILPTIAEPSAGARELGVVLLGSVEARKDELVSVEPGLAVHLGMVAKRAGARTAILAGPVSPRRLSALADRISGQSQADQRGGPGSGLQWADSPFPAHPGPAGNGNGKAGPGGGAAKQVALKVAALPDVSLSVQPEDPGLVVVLPRYAPHNALDRIADLGASTQWPVLGVIGLRSRRFGRRRAGGPGRQWLAMAPDGSAPAPAGNPGPAAHDTIPIAKTDIPPAAPVASVAAKHGADQRGTTG